jgi:beta-galactosidase
MHTPYVFPQECGGRSGVRWLQLSASTQSVAGGNIEQTHAIVIANKGDSPFQISVSPYGVEELACRHHQHELLSASGHHHVHIDVAHMGVGGDDSWSPTVHPQFLVKPVKCLMHVHIQAEYR